jgi:nucleotide-binding universal stress UspA family protein
LLRAKLTLFHAVQPPGIGAASPFIPFGTTADELERDQREQARDQLHKAREVHLAGIDHVGIVELPTGAVATAICDEADALEADLIVVGTHGLTGLSRLLLGSVAEQVVRHARCSVLTLTRDADVSDVAGQRIMVATDFSDSAREACSRADRWAQQLSTSVLLFHACAWPAWVHPTDAASPASGMPTGGVVAPTESYVRDLLNATRAKLEVVRRNQFPEVQDVAVEVTTHTHPATAICDRAERDDVDMIVVGTLGRTGLARLLIGSVAERVVRHATTPVLCVRDRGAPPQV